MAQLMNVRLARSDASPWGFRLQGGKDFGTPLLIQKVNGGSPAERAGLQAGDAVIKVNNNEVYNLRHKDAQDNIVRAGNSFEITVQRGGTTWKPTVTPVGPSPVISKSPVQPVTKTSLASNHPTPSPIGGGYNYSPQPFQQPQQNGTVPSIVNKQYNTPVGIYSEETIAETLSAQAEVLATGVLGVNFKKNEKIYDSSNSEVLKMLNEIANEPRSQEPEYVAPAPAAPAAAAPVVYSAPPTAASNNNVPFSVAGLRHVVAPEPARPAPQDEQKTVLPPGQNICADCERLIVGVFVRIKDKNLHVECFKCATCGTSLKNVGYYNINNKLYCDVHAKLVARQHPPAPNLEPVTVPFGASKPAGAISAALTKSGVNSIAQQFNNAAPPSPQPSTLGPLPFHAPAGFPGAKPFNAPPPAQQIVQSVNVPSVQSAPPAPAPAPFTSPAKPAAGLASGKFVWPPKTALEDETPSSTATPLYIPPQGPPPQAPRPADAIIPYSDQTREAIHQVQPSVQAFPRSYPQFVAESQRPVTPVTMRPYQYTPKPLGSNEAAQRSAFVAPKPAVRFLDDVQHVNVADTEAPSVNRVHNKLSICSGEVMAITERKTLSTSVEQLSDTIGTAMMVSSVAGRPLTPPPVEEPAYVPPRGWVASPMPAAEPEPVDLEPPHAWVVIQSPVPPEMERVHEDEQQLVAALNNVIETQRETIEEIHQKSEEIAEEYHHKQQESSQLVAALTTAPERPFTPVPSTPDTPKSPRPTTLPVTYRQIPEPSEGFVPITDSQHSSLLPLIVAEPPSTDLIAALTTAPDRPYSPLPAPVAPSAFPVPAVPFPHHEPSRQELCASPMISALTIAPQRAYSPFTVPKAPISVVDSVQDMRANVSVGEPFNLPTPSQYSSMLSALTIAPDRAYTPLVVPQAPLLSQTSAPTKTESAFKPVAPKVVASQPEAVFKPIPVIEAEPPKPAPPVIEEPKAPEPPKSVQRFVQIEQPPKDPVNALHQHRDSQQRPITPGLPLPITPSRMTGLTKPATIPHYQQNLGDGDFPCRSPRPVTPVLACPMDESARPRTPKRVITPLPHKQLQVVRGETPKLGASKTQKLSQSSLSSSQSTNKSLSSAEASNQSLSTSQTTNQGQVVVTRNTRVTEEFESFHRESSELIEKSNNSQRTLAKSEMSASLNQQSQLQKREVTTFNANVARKSFSGEGSSAVQEALREESGEQQRKLSITQAELQRKLSLAEAQQQRRQSFTQSEQQRKQSLTQSEQQRKQSLTQSEQQRKQSLTQTEQQRKQSLTQSDSTEAPRRVSIPQPDKPTVQLMTNYFEQQIELEKQQQLKNQQLQPPSLSFEESQRASPLPFPNINLPAGMNYEVVDDKAIYQSGTGKQVYRIPGSIARHVPAPENPRPVPAQAPTPTFKANKLPLAAKFEPVAPQPSAVPVPVSCPIPVVPQPLAAPIAVCPAFQPLPTVQASLQNVPKLSRGPQTFTPKGGNSFRSPNKGPNVVVPPCIEPSRSPPNAGGGGGGGAKGASFAGSSAPVRGRGILNQAAAAGGRVPLCGHCNGHVRGPFVTALGKIWCPEHFVCVNPQCKRQLADIGFVEEKGQLYCEYCFEQFIAPPCAKCSNKIKGDCLNAIGRQYHPECFVCAYCGKLFGNNPFFLEDGLPYCQADWNELFTTKCFACGFPIEAGDRWVEALNNNYHSQCFNCTSCKKNLEGQSFFAKSGRPFCKAHAR